MFNILCEQPETVAAFLVPRIRTVVARNEAQRYIRYLTVWSALTRFITAPLRAQRFFDADGGFTCPNGLWLSPITAYEGDRGSLH